MTTTSAAGFGPPEMNEAGRAAKQTTGLEDQNQRLEFDSQEQATQAIQERDQRIGAAIAHADRLGWQTHVTQGINGSARYVVVRWGRSRDFDGLDQFESWLVRVDPQGVPA
jgi:hypothetical protein